MQEVALEYAARGLAVFPVHTIQNGCCTCPEGAECSSPGKHPASRNGLNDATTDPTRIRRFGKKWNRANIGVRTGAESGIIVIDIDRHDADGMTTVRSMIPTLGLLPACPAAKTGGNGYHLFFKHPGRPTPGKRHTALGIDFKADGGYVVAPPSRHITGAAYQWQIPLWAAKIPILPDEWLTWLQHPSVTQQAHAYTANTANTADTGNQISVEKQVFDCPSSEGSQKEPIQEAIDASLPTGPGERNARIFELVRRLKAIPGVLEQPQQTLRKIVNAWWKKAKPNTSGQHSADDCWFDFLNALENVRSAWGVNPMQDVIEKVRAGDLPEVARDYEDPRVQALIGMCAILQTHRPPGEPFFLSSHQAADVLKAHPMEVHRWLKGLCMAGVLDLVTKGKRGLASEYRYRGAT